MSNSLTLWPFAWGPPDVRWAWHAQQPAPARACRFYAGEMVMSMLALTAALYGAAAANKWSFSIFLGLQGALPCQSHMLSFPTPSGLMAIQVTLRCMSSFVVLVVFCRL